ncbi:hypothetical protein Q2K19_22390 [Micromonospora soli]|uniref:hypothetical protein n=1 Tax=Micromonospora sp. NBRC 110009 TaxID=3061627 RepID=UPI002673677C|nr:hypothetical protein [Micromonospora sp. NBRC 110009]WKT96919.1 hypothetical protein Q2K19_22390 [Micromonospora sp. NBRC 110009]
METVGEPPSAAPDQSRWGQLHILDWIAIALAAAGVRCVHRVCLRKARAAGVDPDKPRHLARSVVLA